MTKRLLYLEDLYDFYSTKYKRSTHFSAEKNGHQIFVQVPAQFEITETDYVDNTLLFCKVKLMHSGENRNHSYVTDEALVKASKGLAYKPVLANFMEYTDKETGETLKDFTSHDMELNNDGSINYIEKQIGCFTSDEPFFEVEEETKHNFLYGYCAIPREYTDGVSIIERKGGTKISVELAINEMQYNSKSKSLELTDVIIMGATCLGKDPKTLKDVGEGMLNARLDIADFSADNNSLFAKYENKMIEFQERLEKLESTCSNKNNTSRKEEEIEVENKENFEEVTDTEEVTETEETTEEEVTVTENESEETVDEASEDETVETEDETTEIKEDNACDEDESEVKEDNACGGSGSGTKKKKNNSVECSYEVDGETKTYSVSLNEKIYAIQDLVNVTYGDADNTYYGVKVYSDYVVMCDYWTGKYFKQSYADENDVYTLTGDRIEVYAEFVTKSELDELNNMRSNYSSIITELKTYKEKELYEKKEELFNSKDYNGIRNTNEFLELKKNSKDYSLDDLTDKLDKLISNSVKNGTFSFSANENEKKKPVHVNFAQKLADEKPKKNSFLDGLLNC